LRAPDTAAITCSSAVVALVAVGDAAIVEVVDIVGVGFKRRTETGDRTVIVAFPGQCIGAIRQCGASGLAGNLVVGNDALASRQPRGGFGLRIAAGVDIARGQDRAGCQQRDHDQEKGA